MKRVVYKNPVDYFFDKEGVLALLHASFSSYLVGAVIAVLKFDVWLLLHPIQVLVQAVKQERKQLLRVLLLITRELGRESPDRHFEVPGHDEGVLPAPHALDQLAEGAGDLALHPQWVFIIYVFDIVVVGKVLGDGRTVGQALKYEIKGDNLYF